MKNLLNSLLEEMGNVDSGFRFQLNSNVDFQEKLAKLTKADSDLNDWCSSHIQMDGFSLAFEKERIKFSNAQVEVKDMLSTLWNERKIEFKLEDTEHLSHLPIRQIFAMAERGELGTTASN